MGGKERGREGVKERERKDRRGLRRTGITEGRRKRKKEEKKEEKGSRDREGGRRYFRKSRRGAVRRASAGDTRNQECTFATVGE